MSDAQCTATSRQTKERCKQRPTPGATSWMTRHRAHPMDARVRVAIPGLTCENRDEAAPRANGIRPLTHSSDLSRERLGMNPTRKRGIDPAPTAPHGLTPELKAIYDAWPSRFRTKVTLGAGCWEWTASKDKHGYGRYGIGGRARGTIMAHRAALELTGTPAPKGTPVDHLCRNPSCVRPDHLEVVPQRINVQRGAAANASGWCRSGRHEWTPSNVLTEQDGTQRCRPCRNEWDRERRRGVA